MRLKDYGRNHQKRKLYIQQTDLLLVGVDISKAKHDACFGETNHTISFKNNREGFQRFEQTLRKNIAKTKSRKVLIAMEPSGLYWYSLYNRLKKCGYGVCLVNCQAVKNNRQTMQGGISKTDKKDAGSILDLLQQGKFFLPVERDHELTAAYKLMRRHMAVKKRVGQIRNQLRGALHLTFPELSNVLKDITQPTALRFLQSNPTPELIMINGRKRFLEKWRPRRKSGQWRPAKLNMIYDLAKVSVGLKDPHRIDAFEIKTLAGDLADALKKQEIWLNKAIELMENRADFQLLLSLPRIGKATAAAILTAIGNISEYTNGKQLVKLAGLDIRYFESGSSIKRRPRISHVGSAYLRHWVFHFGLRLIAHVPEFKVIFQNYKEKSPGKGAGLRGMMVVCDKVLRIIYAMLSKNKVYQQKTDKHTAAFYEKLKKAA
jgi:transposase